MEKLRNNIGELKTIANQCELNKEVGKEERLLRNTGKHFSAFLLKLPIDLRVL